MITSQLFLFSILTQTTSSVHYEPRALAELKASSAEELEKLSNLSHSLPSTSTVFLRLKFQDSVKAQ